MNTGQGLGSLINNRYLLQTIIKQGQYERIYLVEDQAQYSENCILKEFIAREGGNKGVQVCELFAQKLTLLQGLQHPQIQQIRDFFAAGDTLYIVHSYLEGKTYQEYINSASIMESEAIYLLQQILPVLSYLHSQGISHGDISPSNIWLRSFDNLPVLTNFGVIRDIMNEMKVETTQARILDEIKLLPVGFISPGIGEDLYTLAITIIILLTGQEIPVLFNSQTRSWEWENWKVVSDQLANVMTQMLSVEEIKRFPSADAVLQALKPPIPVNIPVFPPVASVPPTPINVPVSQPTVVSYQSNNYTFQPETKNDKPSGLKDWQKALLIGSVIGLFILVAILLTRKFSPQPVAEQSNNQVNVSPEVTPTPISIPTPTPEVQSISQQDAVNFVNTWLQAKRRLFAYPYDQQLGAELTTGKAYRDNIRGPNSNGEAESSLEWLRNRNFYYTYGLQRIDSVERFEQYNNEAVIEVVVTEQRTMYGKNGKVVKDSSGLDTRLVRYILRLENGKLKLSDYNTIRKIS